MFKIRKEFMGYFNIQFGQLPRRAKIRIDGIKQLLDLAEVMEYEFLKIDYNNGLIQLEWGAAIVNLYTTTFTITVQTPPKEGERYPRQKHYKNCTFALAKEIFENPLKFRKR